MFYFNEHFTEAHPEHVHIDSDGVKTGYLYKDLEKVWDTIYPEHGYAHTLYITCSADTMYTGVMLFSVSALWAFGAQRKDPSRTLQLSHGRTSCWSRNCRSTG